MNTSSLVVAAVILTDYCGSLASAQLPMYTVTRTAEFFPALGPAGDPAFPNLTYIYSVSGAGNNYLAGFADFTRPVTPPEWGFVTGSETNFIIDAGTLGTVNVGAPPAGFVTGTSGAVKSSSLGHLVFSVLKPDDRNSPGWLDRTRVARTSPDGITTVLPDGAGIEQRGVNASGTVIGVGPDDFTAWRYTDAGGWQSLGSLGISGYAHPRGINDSGVIVGRSADDDGFFLPFIYTDADGMQPITDDGSIVFGRAEAISNSGLVTGTGNGRAFIFDSNTLDLNWITPVSNQRAADINILGIAVGFFENGPVLGTPGNLAWVATAEDGFAPLTNLIGQDLSDPEWRITEAWDINDAGWILGNAYNYHAGTYHQVILRPIPEPGATGLAVAGLSGLITRRRRIVKPA
jgi:hypothetical protein